MVIFQDVLRELKLPKDNTLFLLAPDAKVEYKTNNGDRWEGVHLIAE